MSRCCGCRSARGVTNWWMPAKRRMWMSGSSRARIAALTSSCSAVWADQGRRTEQDIRWPGVVKWASGGGCGDRPGPMAYGPGEAKTGPVSGASKYASLARWLAAGGAEVIPMTFAEVDQAVVGGLPASAYRYRTWWTVCGGNSAQSRHGWVSAGYRVSRVDLTERLVTFVRAADPGAVHAGRPPGGGARLRPPVSGSAPPAPAMPWHRFSAWWQTG